MKYTFQLTSEASRPPLPHKLVLGRKDTQTEADVLLKLLGYLIFHRERLQMDVNLHQDSIPFVPDLVQLDYELRPVLWVECGECTAARLDKLAVKVPEAEIWALLRSGDGAETLLRQMTKAGLRQNRYHLLALDEGMFQEVYGRLQSRNEILWVGADFDQGVLQFDFNGLWFESDFEIRAF